MSIWLVRAGRNGEGEEFALRNSVAVVGYHEVGNLSNVRSRDDLKNILEKIGWTRGQLNNRAGQLWAFVSQIKKGDLIVLPLKGTGTVAIGEVTGDYKYIEENPHAARHTRNLKWLKQDIPRSSFDQDLLYTLGAFMTVCKVERNNAEERIKKLLNGKILAKKEIEAEQEVSDLSAPPNPEEQAKIQIREYISKHFVGHKLALLVEAILHAQGFKCKVSEPGPDGGVDILAGYGEMGFGAPRLCVQVKSGNAPLDVKILRELEGVRSAMRADKGLLVSWGGCENTVVTEAKNTFFDIRLWDPDEVIGMVQSHYEKFPDSLKADLPLKRIWALILEE